jgi:DeoR/GlpR family transcriptional regulator of sugar metabolism
MTPFVQILNQIEQRGFVRRSELSAVMGRTAESALAQLCERGDIRRIARGVYALPGTPNLPKVRA